MSGEEGQGKFVKGAKKRGKNRRRVKDDRMGRIHQKEGAPKERKGARPLELRRGGQERVLFLPGETQQNAKPVAKEEGKGKGGGRKKHAGGLFTNDRGRGARSGGI